MGSPLPVALDLGSLDFIYFGLCLLAPTYKTTTPIIVLCLFHSFFIMEYMI